MFLKRLSNRVLAPFQLLYWRMAAPQAEGAKVLIKQGENFLLIRETYGPKHWTLPGGRSRKDEEPLETAKRKVREEVGIELSVLIPLGSYFHTRQHKKDVICAYLAHVGTQAFQINPNTVGEAHWFSVEELASLEQSESVDDVLELYHKYAASHG
ncbi:MAG: NUDIX hydrolase [Patescibacteria group bacterium]